MENYPLNSPLFADLGGGWKGMKHGRYVQKSRNAISVYVLLYLDLYLEQRDL